MLSYRLFKLIWEDQINLKEKHIAYFFKKVGVKLAANGLRGFVALKSGLGFFYQRVLRVPLVKTGSFFVSFLLLPGYKGYLFGKRQISKIYHPSGNLFWDVATHRYTIHGLMIFVGLLVVTNNIQARVAGFRDENYGKTTVLYALVGGDELGLVEETSGSNLSEADTSSSYAVGIVSNAPSFPGDEEKDSVAAGDDSSVIVKPEISSMVEPDDQQKGQEQIYIVQEGDSVASISAKFGVSVYTILWENNLSERSYIRPGDKLVILPATGVKHLVKRGETLDKIAKTYGVSQEDILAYNDLIDEGGLKAGETLFIPGGKKLPTYVPAAPRTVQSYVGAPPPSAAISGTNLQWPTSVRKITQYYGWRHTGVDIASRNSPPIYAAESGTVIRAQASGYNGGYGRNVMIDHGNGLVTLYGHMSQLYVNVGDQVTRGQTIGIMGSTGRSTGPHVHFEVRVNGSRVNPLSYIQ